MDISPPSASWLAPTTHFPEVLTVESVRYTFLDGLKFCPFCAAVGGERTADGLVNSLGVMMEERESFHPISRQMELRFRVVCKGCGAQGGAAKNPGYAVKLWNARA